MPASNRSVDDAHWMDTYEGAKRDLEFFSSGRLWNDFSIGLRRGILLAAWPMLIFNMVWGRVGQQQPATRVSSGSIRCRSWGRAVRSSPNPASFSGFPAPRSGYLSFLPTTSTASPPSSPPTPNSSPRSPPWAPPSPPAGSPRHAWIQAQIRLCCPLAASPLGGTKCH